MNRYDDPFAALPPLARVVAWLIVSHHRLPAYPDRPEIYTMNPDLTQVDDWLTRQLTALWNSANMDDDGWDASNRRAVWQFPQGTPLCSAVWRR